MKVIKKEEIIKILDDVVASIKKLILEADDFDIQKELDNLGFVRGTRADDDLHMYYYVLETDKRCGGDRYDRISINTIGNGIYVSYDGNEVMKPFLGSKSFLKYNDDKQLLKMIRLIIPYFYNISLVDKELKEIIDEK